MINHEGGVVLCVEPSVLSLHTFLFYPARIKNWFKREYRFRQVEENIYAFSPLTIEHLLASIRFAPLKWINKILLRLHLRKKLKRLGVLPQNSIFVFHRPELIFLIGLLNEMGVIYDCQDDNCLTSNMVAIKVAGNRERERLFSEKCTFILTTSQKLFDRMKSYNGNTFLCFNGYSNGIFRKSDRSKLRALDEIRAPIVGYIGNIRDWFDFELLDYIIESRKEWTFVFAGSVRKESKVHFERLEEKHGNLISIKDVKYENYPQYLQYFDVGIIPFKVNEFMASVNPNKLFEYMAEGVPVVSSDIGDLKTYFKPYVKIAENKVEFLESLDYVVNLKHEEKMKFAEEISSFGQQYTWEKNAEFMYGQIKSLILTLRD